MGYETPRALPETDEQAHEYLTDDDLSHTLQAALLGLYDTYRRAGLTIAQSLINTLDHACREKPTYPLPKGE